MAPTFDSAQAETIYRSVNAQVSLCDDRNWFASVCIKHGVFQSRRSKRVTRCPAQASNFNKRDVFSIVARFRVLIPAAVCT